MKAERAGKQMPSDATRLHDTDAHGKNHLIGLWDAPGQWYQFGYTATIFEPTQEFSWTPEMWDHITSHPDATIEVVQHEALEFEDQVSYRILVSEAIEQHAVAKIMRGKQQRYRVPLSEFARYNSHGRRTAQPAPVEAEVKPKRKLKVAPEDVIDIMEGVKILECNRCPGLCGSRSQIVNGSGPMRPKIMVIADAPNEMEDSEGKALIGAAGQTLRMWFETCGLNPDRDVYYDNAIKCHPDADKNPTPTEIKNCSTHLRAIIKMVNPDIIIAAGNPACLSLLPPEVAGEGITKLRGHVFWDEDLQRKIVPMFHPSAMLHDFDKEPLCLADIRKALKESKRPDTRPVGLGQYYALTEFDDVMTFIEDMEERAPCISFDTETANRRGGSALNYRSAEILCMGLTDTPGKGWVIPFYGQNWRTIWTPEQREKIIEALKRLFSSSIPKIAQNGKFDEHIMEHDLGIITKTDYDTMYSTALIYENMSRSLESLRGLFTSMPFYDAEVAAQTDGKKHMEWAEEEVIWAYQAADVDCTIRVMMAVDELLEREPEGARWIFDNISLPLAQVFKHMEEHGVLIDPALADRMVEDCDSEIIRVEREVYSHVPEGFELNLNSHEQLKKLLWEVLKIQKPGRLTDGGKKCKHCQNCKNTNDQHWKHTASDSEALSEVRSRHPIIPPLEEYNQLHTLRKTFLLGDEGKNTGLLQHIQDDGRIHTSFRVDGTETGRASSSPNLQNIPKDESGKKDAAPRPDIYKFVRKLFCVPEGHVMINADYSQLELRVLAYISGQEDMIEYFKQPDADIHLWMARLLFPELDPDLDDEPWKKLHKPQRDAAKVFNFGISYGMTVFGIMNRLDCSQGEAEVLLNKYFAKLTKVRDYFHKKDRRLKKFKRADNVLGRPRHFYGVDSMRSYPGYRRQMGHMQRENYNFDIQSAGSDFLSLACIRIDQDAQLQAWGVHLILTVHDSVMFECPIEHAEEATRLILKHMSDVPMEQMQWHMPAEASWGPRWSEWTHDIDAGGVLVEKKEAA